MIGYSEEDHLKINTLENVLILSVRKMKIITVIGEKKTGKSSLAYFLANKLLQEKKNGNIYFFESDVGQPCTCPPGFMSIRHLKSPILKNRTGWTREYFTDDMLSFVGDYSPEFNSDIYFSSFVKLLKKFWT